MLIAIAQQLENLVHFFRSANYYGAGPLTCSVILVLFSKCRRGQGVEKNFQMTFLLEQIVRGMNTGF